VRDAVDGRKELGYMHRPVGLQERLHEARDLIRTEYTVMGGDDEFLLRRGLAEAISVLDREQAVVACMGQSLGFVPAPDGHHLELGSGYPHRSHMNIDADMRLRVELGLSNYTAVTCYAVTRTTVWQASWGDAIDWSSVYCMEIQHAITTWLSGGLVTVDNVYWLRSGENASVRDLVGPQLTFAEWWNFSDYKTEVSRFVDLLAEYAVSVGATDRVVATRFIIEAIEVFAVDRAAEDSRGVILASGPGRSPHHRIKEVARHLIGRLPPSAVVHLRRTWRLVLRLLRRRRDSSLAHRGSLVDDGLLPAGNLTEGLYVELEEVEQIVFEFYRAQ
jgi:hypothetical protein